MRFDYEADYCRIDPKHSTVCPGRCLGWCLGYAKTRNKCGSGWPPCKSKTITWQRFWKCNWCVMHKLQRRENLFLISNRTHQTFRVASTSGFLFPIFKLACFFKDPTTSRKNAGLLTVRLTIALMKFSDFIECSIFPSWCRWHLLRWKSGTRWSPNF